MKKLNYVLEKNFKLPSFQTCGLFCFTLVFFGNALAEELIQVRIRQKLNLYTYICTYRGIIFAGHLISINLTVPILDDSVLNKLQVCR